MPQQWGDDATVNPTPTVRLGYRCEGIGRTSQRCSRFEETDSRGGWKVGGGGTVYEVSPRTTATWESAVCRCWKVRRAEMDFVLASL